MRAKRSLGQNFLKNIGVAEKMAHLAGIEEGDTVLEIGPGSGMLTRVLLRHASTVIAIEKDDHLYVQLKEAMKEYTGLKLVHQDILLSDLGQMILPGSKIVANLPYNIATKLIVRFVDYARRISVVVVMLQKEVAQRICAGVGEGAYSGLSVIIQAAFKVREGFIVGPNNFSPRPRVDSEVVRLTPKSSPIPAEDMAIFKEVVSCAFSQRRKVLKNTLIELPHMDHEMLGTIAQEVSIDVRSRPQSITPEQYHLFSKAYGKFLG